MDVERSSLCNCVVNFLLEENYLLTAFELLHELLDDGRDDQAIRLKNFFSDPSQFPPDQITRFNTLRGWDSLLFLFPPMFKLWPYLSSYFSAFWIWLRFCACLASSKFILLFVWLLKKNCLGREASSLDFFVF